MTSTPPTSALLLDGVTVVELGTMITAPYAGMLLGELGAAVIKVEQPDGGDPFRATGGGPLRPELRRLQSRQAQHHPRSQVRAGKEAFRRLLGRADVLVENYRTGVMDKLGFPVEAIRAINPRIVHCSITGFGATGPYRNRPAYDAVASALSGIYGLAVDPADPRLVGVTISDNVTGMYAVNGIVAALYQRERTGTGRRIEVNMLECSIGFTPDAFAHLAQTGVEYGPTSRIASSQCFAFTCADGKPLAIHLSVQTKFWESLLRLIDRAGDRRRSALQGALRPGRELSRAARRAGAGVRHPPARRHGSPRSSSSMCRPPRSMRSRTSCPTRRSCIWKRSAPRCTRRKARS